MQERSSETGGEGLAAEHDQSDSESDQSDSESENFELYECDACGEVQAAVAASWVVPGEAVRQGQASSDRHRFVSSFRRASFS